MTSQELVRKTILDLYSDYLYIDELRETLEALDDDESLGPCLSTFDNVKLSEALTDMLKQEVVVSWCDSVNDIAHNYHKLFEVIVSPN